MAESEERILSETGKRKETRKEKQERDRSKEKFKTTFSFQILSRKINVASLRVNEEKMVRGGEGDGALIACFVSESSILN